MARTSHLLQRHFTEIVRYRYDHFALLSFTTEKIFAAARQSIMPGNSGFRRWMKPKRTILCVDDNEQSLSYRKIMLETRGYRVASYARGEEALERFKLGGVDLVVTDMAMPGLDGPQLIAAIKNLSPQTPAILISSKVRVYDHDSQADVFLARGMYAPADLLERIRLLLVRKRGPKKMQHRPQQLARRQGAA
jgi:two-component system, OmpR family, response regulator CpxR